jgi:subtilase family serine protease
MWTRSFLFLILVAGTFRPAPSSVLVRGHIHRMAQPRFDRGQVADLFQMNYVAMMFKPTPEQQNALDTLIEQQQDPSSPYFHRWLTPKEFGDRFGLSSAQYDKIVAWLQERGFTIHEAPESRNWLAFTATARQLREAFNLRIHEYVVNGEVHYAAANEPSVPAEFEHLVLGFRSLHNFRAKSRIIRPRLTDNTTNTHALAPDDIATIYNVRGAYSSSLTGAGQKIAVVGQTDFQLQDIRAFRAAAGLSASDPQVILVPGVTDPGIVDSDVDEASLDVEWAGAVAKDATVLYVNSDDVLLKSLPYAVSQNVAPVVSISYGDCEANWTVADRNTLIATAQQANAQGMTIAVASGDGGAADCDSDFAGRFTARLGLSVDFPAALPYVTAIGGTEFNEPGLVWTPDHNFGSFLGKSSTAYWSPANNGSNGSALSYIPEMAWNDTLYDLLLAGTGGGRSTLFPKPAWQVAPGVPNDSARDVPDVSFSASVDIDPYLMCSRGSCVNGFRAADNTLNVVGGTSVGTPAFAGVVALINQMTNSTQGNINPMLYRVFSNTPYVFHDTLQSGNQVPCRVSSPDCGSSGFLGYTATPGYDLTTGLGSFNVFKLLQVWSQNQP